jgi:hypothetical protein
MTLTDHERPRTTPKAKLSRPPVSRASTPPLYVPQMPEPRPKLRATLVGLAALGLLGGVALAPWQELPSGGAGWRQAFLDVGVPRQYRDLMSEGGPRQASEPPVAEFHEDPSLTALLGKTPAPPPAAVEPSPAPTAAATPPVPAPPAPKLFTARTVATPAEPPRPAPAPVVKAEAEVEPSSDAQSYRVQIAATGSDAEAEAAWRKVKREFPDETTGRSLAVKIAEVNGRVVRRAIVTGFPSSQAAKAFCARLTAADRGCILRGKG